MSTRSSASRFDSGSSKRKTCGLAHHGAADGDALALAAGEVLGPPVEQHVDLQHRGDFADLGRDLGLGRVDVFQPEGEVLAHRHVRVERVGLEHHGQAPVGGGDGVDDLVADGDLAAEMGSSPAIMRRSVDLPQPEGPTKTQNSPCSTCRSMPLMTSTAP
jgi:hypothetical protein